MQNIHLFDSFKIVVYVFKKLYQFKILRQVISVVKVWCLVLTYECVLKGQQSFPSMWRHT